MFRIRTDELLCHYRSDGAGAGHCAGFRAGRPHRSFHRPGVGARRPEPADDLRRNGVRGRSGVVCRADGAFDAGSLLSLFRGRGACPIFGRCRPARRLRSVGFVGCGEDRRCAGRGTREHGFPAPDGPADGTGRQPHGRFGAGGRVGGFRDGRCG